MDEDLEDKIKEASLYSVIEVTEATIIDDCMLLLEHFEFVSTSLIEPVSMRKVCSEMARRKLIILVLPGRSRTKALVVEAE